MYSFAHSSQSIRCQNSMAERFGLKAHPQKLNKLCIEKDNQRMTSATEEQSMRAKSLFKIKTMKY